MPKLSTSGEETGTPAVGTLSPPNELTLSFDDTGLLTVTVKGGKAKVKSASGQSGTVDGTPAGTLPVTGCTMNHAC